MSMVYASVYLPLQFLSSVSYNFPLKRKFLMLNLAWRICVLGSIPCLTLRPKPHPGFPCGSSCSDVFLCLGLCPRKVIPSLQSVFNSLSSTLTVVRARKQVLRPSYQADPPLSLGHLMPIHGPGGMNPKFTETAPWDPLPEKRRWKISVLKTYCRFIPCHCLIQPSQHPRVTSPSVTKV